MRTPCFLRLLLLPQILLSCVGAGVESQPGQASSQLSAYGYTHVVEAWLSLWELLQCWHILKGIPYQASGAEGRACMHMSPGCLLKLQASPQTKKTTCVKPQSHTAHVPTRSSCISHASAPCLRWRPSAVSWLVRVGFALRVRAAIHCSAIA